MSADFLLASDWSGIDEVNEDGKDLTSEGSTSPEDVGKVLYLFELTKAC